MNESMMIFFHNFAMRIPNKKKSLGWYKRTLTSLFSQQQPSLIIIMSLAWLSEPMVMSVYTTSDKY